MKIFKDIRITTEFNAVLAVFLTMILISQVLLLSSIRIYTSELGDMNREVISKQVDSYVTGKVETLNRIKNEVGTEVVVSEFLGQNDTALRDKAFEQYAKKLSEIQSYCSDTFYMVLEREDNRMEKLMENMSPVEYASLTKAMANENNVNGEIYIYEIENKAYKDYRYMYTVIPIIGYDSEMYKTIDYGNVGLCLKMDLRNAFSAENFSSRYENLNININVNGEDINFVRSAGNNSHVIQIRGNYVTNTNWEITGYVYDYTYNTLYKMKSLIYICMLTMLVLLLVFRKIIVREIINPISSICTYLKNHRLNDRREKLTVNSNKDINELADEVNKFYEKMRKDARQTLNNHRTLYEKEILNVETQLKLLQNQVNPHFIYNTFETIRVLASLNEVEEIENIINALTGILRYNLDGRDKVKICEEIEIILKYIEIMSVRYDDTFSFEYVCDEDVEDEAILKMMCQPIIENCFSHGFKSDGSKLNIRLEIRTAGDKIIISISDDGKGMSSEKRSEILKQSKMYSDSSGIGLSNLMYRLRLCYNDDFDFQILSDENVHTVINITVPKVQMSPPPPKFRSRELL